MSDVFRISLRGNFRDRLRATLPGASADDLAAFDVLLARDCVVADDGSPHPELVAWVQAILDRDAGDAVPAPVRPVPKTGPAGAEVVA